MFVYIYIVIILKYIKYLIINFWMGVWMYYGGIKYMVDLGRSFYINVDMY